MAVILDIGNTHTRLAVWGDDGFDKVKIIDSSQLSPELIPLDHSIYAASVNPPAAEKLKDLPIRFLRWNSCGNKLDFSMVDPSTLGPDRIANAVALAEFFPLPGAVFDCGTAITLEIVDEKRRFRGGAIAPGRQLLRRALTAGGALLPDLPWNDTPPQHPGCNTIEAMSLGVDRGAAGTVRELLAVAARDFPLQTVLVTGGDRYFFASALPELQLAPENFTLHGIRAALMN